MVSLKLFIRINPIEDQPFLHLPLCNPPLRLFNYMDFNIRLVENNMTVVKVNQHKDWIVALTSVETAETIFRCKLSSYSSKRLRKTKIAAQSSYSIPDEVASIVEFISGLTTFPGGRWNTVHGREGLAEGAPVTPTTIYEQYGVAASGSHGSKLGSQGTIHHTAASLSCLCIFILVIQLDLINRIQCLL